MSNAQTVKDIYTAFIQGNVPAVLERLSESVEWEYGMTTPDVPWLQPRRGRKGVADFFMSLGEHLEVHRFTPKAVLESDGLVVSLVDFDGTVKRTGRRLVEEDEVHIWHFDKAGRVARFRHRSDTYQSLEAWRGA